MKDWNVVASVQPEGFARALRILRGWGPVDKTNYYNVLVLRVEDVARFIGELRDLVVEKPRILDFLGRVVPCHATFDFHGADDFEEAARAAVVKWAPRLAGEAFHVRMHRRGLKGRMSSQEEEQLLDSVLLAALEAAGTPGRITFDDPGAILAVETVGPRAGLSFWTREDLAAYPFLRLN